MVVAQSLNAAAPALAQLVPGFVVNIAYFAGSLVMCGVDIGEFAVVTFVGLGAGGPVAFLGLVLIIVAALQVELSAFLVFVRQFAEEIGTALDDGVDTRLEMALGGAHVALMLFRQLSQLLIVIRLGLLAQALGGDFGLVQGASQLFAAAQHLPVADQFDRRAQQSEERSAGEEPPEQPDHR